MHNFNFINFYSCFAINIDISCFINIDLHKMYKLKITILCLKCWYWTCEIQFYIRTVSNSECSGDRAPNGMRSWSRGMAWNGLLVPWDFFFFLMKTKQVPFRWNINSRYSIWMVDNIIYCVHIVGNTSNFFRDFLILFFIRIFLIFSQSSFVIIIRLRTTRICRRQRSCAIFSVCSSLLNLVDCWWFVSVD